MYLCMIPNDTPYRTKMKKPSVKLTPEQVQFLKAFKQQGKRSLREINRANILLLLDKGKKAIEIADFLDVGRNTVSRTKHNFLRGGLTAALEEDARPGQPRKYKPRQEAEIIALACSDPPEGRERWTLELLTRESKKRPGLETINRESIRLMLKKTNVNLG
jgi:putative transposase